MTVVVVVVVVVSRLNMLTSNLGNVGRVVVGSKAPSKIVSMTEFKHGCVSLSNSGLSLEHGSRGSLPPVDMKQYNTASPFLGEDRSRRKNYELVGDNYCAACRPVALLLALGVRFTFPGRTWKKHLFIFAFARFFESYVCCC